MKLNPGYKVPLNTQRVYFIFFYYHQVERHAEQLFPRTTNVNIYFEDK